MAKTASVKPAITTKASLWVLRPEVLRDSLPIALAMHPLIHVSPVPALTQINQPSGVSAVSQ
jgi:hypothetical protein